ncbi:hypothetical protein Ciccas_000413, partial [Cichlidogyrus casuarinus]
HGIFLLDTLRRNNRRKIKEVSDFDWRRNIRAYIEDSSEGNEEDEKRVCYAVVDRRLRLGNEFVGAKPAIGFCSQFEKSIVALLLNLQTSFYGYDSTEAGTCFLAGLQNSGKKALVGHIANLLWRPHRVLQAVDYNNSDTRSFVARITNLCQSLAKIGGFLMLENVESLSPIILGIVGRISADICDALGSRSCSRIPSTSIIRRSSSLQLSYKSFGLILSSSYWGQVVPMPDVVRTVSTQMRCMHHATPDLVQVLKAQAISLGFRYPADLAARLQAAFSMIRNAM